MTDDHSILARVSDRIGDRWIFLILSLLDQGVHHFDEMQNEIGIARNILANRLARLVEDEMLIREVVPADRRRVKYQLTEKGSELLRILPVLRQWGEKWLR